MRILVSGFEPFLDEKVNPTALIANHVNSCAAHRLTAPGFTLDVRGVILPVIFDGAFERLKNEMIHFKPDVVVCFGLAGGSMTVDIERLAVNIRGGHQSARGDNAGNSPNGPVLAGAPLALESTLPCNDILSHLKKAGVPAKPSFSAGTYVCNDLFFQLQNALRYTRVQSGFIHVPRMISDGEIPSESKWAWSQFEKTVDAVLAAFAART